MKAEEFSRLEEILAPIFPALKASVVRRTQFHFVNKVVLDLGGGTGQWLESFNTEGVGKGILLDQDRSSILFARKKWLEQGHNHLFGLVAVAEAIPLDSHSVHLVLSRNSLHFWTDVQNVLSEIYRVLVPAGIAFVGRGFGPDLDPGIREQVKFERKRFYETVQATGDGNPSPDPKFLKEIALQQGFQDVQIVPDAKSYWLLARKP